MSAKLRLCLFLSLASQVAFAQNAPLFHFTEKPGPNAVGLKVVEQYDYSRSYRSMVDELGKPYVGERARPLQTLIWYPAKKNAGKPMTIMDYGSLWATETSFGKPQMPAGATEWMDGMKPTVTDSLWAVRDAPLASGKFPVVIYAPSFSMVSWENADLCEFLASHGYVVIASPDMGATTRGMTSDVAGINAQAGDINFLIAFAHSLPDADLSEVAVAGFSWGGISNLFAAARNNQIDALVALDGSMRYAPHLVKQADIHPEWMTIPLLYFSEGEISLEDQAQAPKEVLEAPNVLNEWTHGDLIKIDMLGMIHTEYSSMYQRNENVWKNFPRAEKADYGREDGIPGYAWMARYTVQFLDAYLKHDAAAMAYLKATPAENGVPKHFLSVNYRAAKGAPPTLDGFRTELNLQGFDHAAKIYAAMQKESPDFKLDKDSLVEWAQSLIAQDHTTEAINLLKFAASINTASGEISETLGDAYAKSGQSQLALDNYKTALKLNKGGAKDRVQVKLNKLNATPPMPTPPVSK